MNFMKSTIYIICLLSAMLAVSCGGDDRAVPADALAVVGNDMLMPRDVNNAVPAGLSSEDSATFAKAYIRNWIDTRLVERVAAAEVDMELVDRLTREYRDELIMSQYRRSMARQAQDGEFSEDSLIAYYDAHTSDFILERPMVKGVYIKVPSDAPGLSKIRRLYRSATAGDIDKLEKAVLGTAIHYDYFRDSWVDWEQIENRIPVELTPNDVPDIARRGYLEAESQGFIYLLCVSDYIPAGKAMPYESARQLVRERMLNQRRRAYDTRLLNDLYHRAIDDGILIVNN